MRLTLRTLLAYLDEVLEPDDAEQLEGKIQESDFASGLVHRIRNSMGRLRLSCPAPLAKGLAEDANSVGEYIDSTLPEERIADFERACLESDMHLSEVASCHQIVTWVVREPADVEPGMRERIRQLGAEQSAAVSGTAGGYRRVDDALASLDDQRDEYTWKGGDVEPVVQGAATDYMQAGRKRNNAAPWVVAALAAFLVTVGFLLNTAGDRKVAQSNDAPMTQPNAQAQADGQQNDPSIVQPNNSLPVENRAPAVPETFGGPLTNDSAVPVAPTESEFVRDSQFATNGTGPALESPSQMGAADGSAIDGDLALSGLAPNVPVAVPVTEDSVGMESIVSPDAAQPVPPLTIEPAATNDFPGSDVAATVPPNASPKNVVVGNGANLAAPVLTGQPDPNDLADASMTRIEPALGSGSEAADPATMMTDGAPLAEPADAVATADAENDVAAEVVAPVTPIDAGRFISDREVLAYWDEAAGVWGRVTERGQLALDVRYRVPTAFRPQLLLGGGAQTTVAGRSEFMLGQPAEGDSPIVRVGYGRFVFAALDQDADSITVDVDGQPLQLLFGDSESECAIEVTSRLVSGVDPIQGVRERQIHVWSASGNVGVQWGENQTRAVKPGEVWSSTDGSPGQLSRVEEIPIWTRSAQLTDIDRTALMKIEPMLDVNRSLTLSLSEAAEHRRQEVRALAARCLASLERFEPLTDSLGDPKQHPAWLYQFRELQAALARDPATAERVFNALRTTAGQDAEKLFRHLWGYSKAQLDAGAATELLELMEAGSLTERVLAFQNLHAATKKTLYYRPEQPGSRRKESTTQWRRQLAGGQMVTQDPDRLSATE